MQNATSNVWPSEDKFGICRLSLLPLYASASPGSSLVSQLLYGETYRLMDVSEDRNWIKVEAENYAGSGWMAVSQHHSLDEEMFLQLQQSDFQVTLSDIVTIQLFERQGVLTVTPLKGHETAHRQNISGRNQVHEFIRLIHL
ncbi:hypothetical protein [Lunatimonas salinarum]|uniref:hypothetical protein n=1 Tax=Lunatimonas salinarum TaxID=1774590 RepID=UPI001ADFCA36|nr:hypothetical protein [Lunatimonas salinarum]